MVGAPIAAQAQQWIAPTPEELKMTAVPDAPDAKAMVLNRDELTDDDNHMRSRYMRIKILTDAGKDLGDVRIAFDQRSDGDGSTVSEIAGRTIQPDGTIVPFTGKPYEKVSEKGNGYKIAYKVFSMPAVQVGSIIEYRYKQRWEDNRFRSPDWEIQSDLYLRKGHFLWKPTDKELISSSRGRENTTSMLVWDKALPKGVELKNTRLPNGRLLLEVNVDNVPPFGMDEYMPPYQNAAYHVHFYYTPYHTPVEFWKTEGGYWSADANKFMGYSLMSSGSAFVHDAAVAALEGATTDEDKARKLYAFTGTLENTDFSREHSAAENKGEGLKETKTAEDVLRRKRGSSDQIALTYVAMARAVGLNASAMVVADRRFQTLNANWLDFNRQLSDDIAIVAYGGSDHFLDPGSPFCPFGHLQWNHASSGGVRQQQGKETALVGTADEGYKASRTARVADLKLDEQGHMAGTVTLTFTGSPATEWRQIALRTDTSEVKEKLNKYLEAMMPGGTDAKVTEMLGLQGIDAPLKVSYAVSGNIGSHAGSRVVLPSDVFVSTERPVFPHTHREQPVYFHYPETVQDAVRVTYPASFTLEAVPADQRLLFKQGAAYTVRSKAAGNSVTVWRDLMVGEFYYPLEEYPELRKFYADFEHLDHGTIVLKQTGSAAAASAGGSGE